VGVSEEADRRGGVVGGWMGLEGRREGEVEGCGPVRKWLVFWFRETVDVLVLGSGRLGLGSCIQAMNMIVSFESD